MSRILERWNKLSQHEAVQGILPCCGSEAWARQLVARRPLKDEVSLIAVSDEVWRQLRESDWMEAFSKHPRIGGTTAPPLASLQSASWSAQEQQGVTTAAESLRLALADANREYELRFSRVFIVCATGKSAADMLDILRRRLQNDEATELRESAEEQRQITNIRLKKWLSQ